MYDSTGHDSNTGPQQLVHQLVHYPHNRLQVSSLEDEDNSLRLLLGIDLGWANLLGDRFTSVSIHACAQVDYGKPNGKTVQKHYLIQQTSVKIKCYFTSPSTRPLQIKHFLASQDQELLHAPQPTNSAYG